MGPESEVDVNTQQPIYTERARCQDCYKCVRACPVKAIQVVDDSAAVVAERCVYCGTCVNVCPAGAKKVRDDLGRARLLLKRRTRVVASLAPSFVSEFPEVSSGRMIRALKHLGFWAVSETALGAQEVSAACGCILAESGPGLSVSTACPTVVELIRKYLPTQVGALTPLCSPLLAHARMLKGHYGVDTGVVFFGPCIAKKLEADEHPRELEVALTFADLRRWFEDEGLDLAQIREVETDAFEPRRSGLGTLYPVDGGMIRGIQSIPPRAGESPASFALEVAPEPSFMAFSGIGVLREALEGLSGVELDRRLFLELLACEGGCVNGPGASKGCGTALKWMRIQDYLPKEGASESAREPAGPALSSDALFRDYLADPVPVTVHEAEQVLRALHLLGKGRPEDELNCGGCGYDTCRTLAGALLEGRAEPNMCVSQMRRLAMNKANALIRSMPAGVVIVDENLLVVECNRRFAETLGGDTPMVFDAKPGMAGADLAKVAPEMRGLFRRVLELPEADLPGGALRRDIRCGEGVGGDRRSGEGQGGERILRLTVFPVDPGRVVGGVLQDITEPSVQREQILQQAQEVIRKNVTTVQQIAFLLGENAAETEMILNSISSSFRSAPSPLGGPAPQAERSWKHPADGR